MPATATPAAAPLDGELARRLGELLQAHREASGLSRRQLAAASGLAPNTLRAAELGLDNPTLARVAALAAVYGVGLDLVPVDGPLAAVAARRTPRMH